MVLFGDGAGAMVLGPMETDDPKAGIMYTSAHADGTGAMDLCLKIYEIRRMPYLDYDPADRENNALMYPHMEGKRVFLEFADEEREHLDLLLREYRALDARARRRPRESSRRRPA